jgi:hypothetical protein
MEAVALKPPGWNDMPPGDKQAWLLDKALDRKREILSMPLPDESDDSIESTRLRALILAAADSTIGQTIALRSNMLAMAHDTRADEHDRAMEALIEERRQKALSSPPAIWEISACSAKISARISQAVGHGRLRDSMQCTIAAKGRYRALFMDA